jgi:GNAT superfamily N-acetyltransferase
MTFVVEELTPGEVDSRVLAELERLYAASYHRSQMYAHLTADIRQRPQVFRLFVARDAHGAVVGARAILTKRHPRFDYLDFLPVHGKRFSVAPQLRGRGVGKQLLDADKEYVFCDLGLAAIFGESNEIGALAMHGREGALYLAESIAASFQRNTREQALAIFAVYLENKELRQLRFSDGNGVHFVACRDDETARLFRKRGYLSKAELLERYAPAR